jgi:hypothetical protein
LLLYEFWDPVGVADDVQRAMRGNANRSVFYQLTYPHYLNGVLDRRIERRCFDLVLGGFLRPGSQRPSP